MSDISAPGVPGLPAAHSVSYRPVLVAVVLGILQSVNTQLLYLVLLV